MTERERVPVSSQAPPLKPPHAPQVPVIVAAHPVVPSVSRVHARLSATVSLTQVPALHVQLVTSRLWVPDSLQASA